MSGVETTRRDVQAIVERYRAIGLYGGLFVGAVIGVLVAGPHFREWSSARSLLTIAGSAGLATFIGYFAAEIAVASLASGGAADISGGAGDVGGPGGGDAGGDS